MATPQDDEPTTARSFDWPLETTLLSLAWVFVALSPLVVGGGDPSFYLQGPVLPIILLALGLLVAHVRLGRGWTYLAAGIGVSLMPIMILAMFGTAQLTDPLLRWEFPANILLFVALLIALPTGIVGFVRERRDASHPRTRDLAGQGHAIWAVVLVGAAVGAIAAGALAAGQAADLRAAGGTDHDLDPDRTVEVVMRDELFVPETIELAAGEIVEIRTVNEDDVFHTFTYDRNGTTYNHDVHGGETVTFLTTFEEAGTVPLWCEPHQPHMVGEFDVATAGAS